MSVHKFPITVSILRKMQIIQGVPKNVGNILRINSVFINNEKRSPDSSSCH